MTPLGYRAWDKARKEFSNGNIAFDCYGMLYWIFGETARIADRDDFIVMQSTGLRDKNGKEIFEGDIVKYGTGLTPRGYPGVVVWQTDGAYFRIKELDSDMGFAWHAYGHELKCEVIGNIHENPDLFVLPSAA